MAKKGIVRRTWERVAGSTVKHIEARQTLHLLRRAIKQHRNAIKAGNKRMAQKSLGVAKRCMFHYFRMTGKDIGFDSGTGKIDIG